MMRWQDVPEAGAGQLPGGLVYDAPPRAVRTVDAVREVVTAFAGPEHGMTSGQIRHLLKRDIRGVQRALVELVDSGEITYSERVDPRFGPKAPRKRIYRGRDRREVVERASDRLLYGELENN